MNSTARIMDSIAALPNIVSQLKNSSDDLHLQLAHISMLGNGLYELVCLFIMSLANNDINNEEPQLLMKAIHAAEVEINRKMSILLLTIKSLS